MALTYRKDIDGLRALAVLPIVLFHAGVPYFGGGFVGVDIFFVISGFLITSIITDQRARGAFRFRDFYERRARRILPALFFVLLLCLPMAWIWMLPRDLAEFADSLLAVIGFASNFFFWRDSGYFSIASELRPLLHTWSLAVEEQYYLLFPALLILILRAGQRVAIAALGLLGFASLVLAESTARSAPMFAFFLLPTRVWEFVIGSLVAYAAARVGGEGFGRHGLREAGSMAGLILILWSVFAFTNALPYPSLWTVLPTLGTALVILLGGPDTLTGKLLGMSPLVSIGLISYSTYLWHQPVFAFARLRQLGPLTGGHSAALIVVSLALGYVTWKFVEPIWHGGSRRNPRSLVICLTGAAILMAVFALASQRTGGFPGRFANVPPDYFSRSWLALKMTGVAGQKCYTPNMMPCVMAKSTRDDARVLMLGDSHASDFGTDFQRFLERNGYSGSMYAIPGCAYLASQRAVNDGDCGRGRDLVADFARDRAFGTYLLIGNYIDHTESKPAATRDADIASFSDLVTRLLDSDARVVLFKPRLSLRYDPKKAGALGLNAQNRPVDFNRDNVAAWEAAWADLAKNPNFEIFSEDDALFAAGCGARECFDGHSTGGNLLYRDSNHLTDLGAKVVFDAFSSD